MPDAAPLIETRALSKAFGYRAVLKKLDFSVARGAFVALLGPNGSGKSTLLRLLCGLSQPTAGTITVGGWSLPGEAAAVRAQIGMVGHKALLYESLTAQENLRFFGQLYNITLTSEEIDTRLDNVGLKKHANQIIRTFSRGMQQRLSIARALLHNPAVLLFDEPYTGLDQDAAAMLDELLLAVHAEGRTIIMSTHQLDRAARLAERVVILARGSIGYDGAPLLPDGTPLSTHYTAVTGMAVAR